MTESQHDPQTGLLTRQGLLDAVEHDLSVVGDDVGWFLLVNIDRLNSINQALGEWHGDDVLVAIAERLRLATRADDVLCRLGGDQFAIYLRRPTNVDHAEATAGRVLALTREPLDVAGQLLATSVSIGISHTRATASVGTLLREADIALMAAKVGGRDRFEVFDAALRDAVDARSRLEGELRLALGEDMLEIHYQPEVDLATGEVVAVEALVRWLHPTRGLLNANRFVALAEETGMVTELGSWVLRTACERLAAWSPAHPGLTMRVNISAVQLTRPDLIDEVVDLLESTGLEPSRLCLELTETAVMAHLGRSTRVLADLRSLGVAVAIDDFGTGFSSLANLRRVPADVLKLDRAFIKDLGDERGDAIVSAVLSLAAALNLDVVAEGVEHETQRQALTALGCRRAQGHLFATALTEVDLLEWLSERRGLLGPAGVI